MKLRDLLNGLEVLSSNVDLDLEITDVSYDSRKTKAGDLFADAVDVGGVKLVTAVLPETDGGELRELCDRCKDRAPEKAVVVLAGTSQEKGAVTFVCWCTKDAVAAGANAGTVVREVAALCGGKGGGKPDMAMAGGKELSAVPSALEKVAEIVGGMLK